MFSGDYDLDFVYGNPWAQRLLTTDVGARWFDEEAPLLHSKDILSQVADFKGKTVNYRHPVP